MLYAIIATVLVSLFALVGILFFGRGIKKQSWMRGLIGLSTGTLLAAVFFDLLPETLELFEEPHDALLIVFGAIMVFFVIEKIIHYHHCRCGGEGAQNSKKHVAINSLIGDGFHNFIDGTVIAGAFLLDVKLGIITTIAVALHEIPQEIADFTILVYAGFSRAKAAFYNVLFGLTSVIGAVLVFVFAGSVERLVPVLLAVASGNFLYLAMADLIPELHEETHVKKIWSQLVWIALGIFLMYVVGKIGGHE